MGNKEKTLSVIVGPEGASKYMIDGEEVDKRVFVKNWPSKDGNLKITISGDDEESDKESDQESDAFTQAMLKDLPKSRNPQDRNSRRPYPSQD